MHIIKKTVIEWLLFKVNSAISAISWREQVCFQWKDDDVRFVLDQDVECYVYSASSLKEQSAGRHVAPLWHIILIPSSFYLILRALREATNTNFIVFGVLLKQIFCFNTISLKYKKQDIITCIQGKTVIHCRLNIKPFLLALFLLGICKKWIFSLFWYNIWGIEDLRVSVRFFTYIYTFIYYILRLTSYDL